MSLNFFDLLKHLFGEFEKEIKAFERFKNFRPTRVQIAGSHFMTKEGILMASQITVPSDSVSANTPILFSDDTGATGPGPSTGSVTLIDATTGVASTAASVSLSTDGQSIVWVIVPGSESSSATLSYSGTSDKGVALSDSAPVTFGAAVSPPSFSPTKAGFGDTVFSNQPAA